jgi:hypothetical protein
VQQSQDYPNCIQFGTTLPYCIQQA